MFAIVDIETCGPKYAYERGRIIDICILVHDGLQVVDKFSTLINPECHISSFYTQLSGISNEMVRNAPRFHEVAKDILSYTEGKLFVAHNVSFDYNFIKDEFAGLGYTFKRDTLCTVRLSRKLIPGHKSYSLGKLCDALQIPIYDRHRAEGDAVATAVLFDRLLQVKAGHPQYKSTSVAQLMSTRKENIKKYILQKIPASCGVYYFLDAEHRIRYIGKSIDMYARAIQHFNTDIKKTQKLLNELTNVDYVETGSELIALLLESEEIKKHKPEYNTLRKRDVFTHSIVLERNEHEGHQLRIVPLQENTETIQSFTSYAAARERLEQWVNEFRLCLHACHLSTGNSACFNYHIKKCNGLCAQEEPAEEYNQRIENVLQYTGYDYPDFMLVDRGRKPGEKSFVWIKQHRFAGYGYINEDDSIHNPNELNNYLHEATYYPDADDLIKGWMRQKPRHIVRFSKA
jgi:DNA polymerase-3 subunit epsilon